MIRKSILIIVICFQVCCVSNKQDLTVLSNDPDLKLDNGALFYKKKLFNGSLLSYYSSDSIKSSVQYVKGRKEGVETIFYSDGLLQTHRTYTKGIKIGIHKGWWPDGSFKFEYHFDNLGRYHGSVKEWYSNGQLLRVFNYTEGKENGRQQMFKPNGTIKANYEVVNGERFGLIGLKRCYTVKKDSTKMY